MKLPQPPDGKLAASTSSSFTGTAKSRLNCSVFATVETTPPDVKPEDTRSTIWWYAELYQWAGGDNWPVLGGSWAYKTEAGNFFGEVGGWVGYPKSYDASNGEAFRATTGQWYAILNWVWADNQWVKSLAYADNGLWFCKGDNSLAS